MEKPSWAFNEITYFNFTTNNNTNCFIFSDFEHNWDLFQFLSNDNKYFFCLNNCINSEFNFNIVNNTYVQKCKHINKENIYFIIFNSNQEQLIKNYPLLSNFFKKDDAMILLNIDETLIKHFGTYIYNDAISLINNKNKLQVNKDDINILVKQNTIKRCNYEKEQFNNIIFFGTSVTEQKYSYVNYLIKSHKNSNIIKKGYSGCHINQAIWLVDDIINIASNINTPTKSKVCILEWITSIYKPNSVDLKCFLKIIVEKLIKNNIIPIFLYLYKTDINDYLEIIKVYEEIANYYNISSMHFYKVLQIMNIDYSLLLKDSCHTQYNGSNLYGSFIETSIYQYLLQDEIPIENTDKSLIHNWF